MSVAIVIPARFASQRFPGKPLAPIIGPDGTTQSLIERSWRAAIAVPGVAQVAVATDDPRIRQAAEAFGAKVIMTSPDCANGTERCAEAVDHLPERPEIVINLQGDAPLTPPWFIEALISDLMRHTDVQMATPVLRCTPDALAALRADRAAGRVGGTTAVFTEDRKALYFSKEVIPHSTDPSAPVYHHVGVYAYRTESLKRYARWPLGVLEQIEGLEQLRFLEQGIPIRCTEVEARGAAFWEVNNPSDIPRVEAILRASAT